MFRAIPLSRSARSVPLAALGIFLSAAAPAGAQCTETELQKLVPSHNGAGDGHARVALDGTTAMVGLPFDDSVGTDTGGVQIWRREGMAWVEGPVLFASDASSGDGFGSSVALHGNAAIVGAPFVDTQTGAAYVMRLLSGTWIHDQRLDASDGAVLDRFGSSVAVHGDLALVSGQDFGGDGKVYAFRNDGFSWVEEQVLTSGAGGDFFGFDLALDGARAVVGAHFDGAGAAGAVYVYERAGGSWVLEQKLVASDAGSQEHFGSSVALSGDRLAVGAPGNGVPSGNSGHVYVFDFDGATWNETHRLVANSAFHLDRFGEVALDGDTLLVGARQDDDGGLDSGGASLWRFDGSAWHESHRLLGSDTEAGDAFGVSVALDGTRALIGATNAGSPGVESGAVYWFSVQPELEGGQATETQQVFSAQAAGDDVGVSMAIDGELAIVGARGDDGAGADAGKAYVLRKVGGSWEVHQELVGSDTAAGDCFGQSVAIHGDLIAVGAPFHGAGAFGAVYVFRQGFDGTWFEQSKVVNAFQNNLDQFGISVALEDAMLIVGRFGNSVGGVHPFFFDGASWVPGTSLQGDAGEVDLFGSRLALRDDVLAVGEHFNEDGKGSVRVYRRDLGGALNFEAQLFASDAGLQEHFGESIAVSGDRIAVGAIGQGFPSSNPGKVYVFEKVGGSWVETQVLTPAGAGIAARHGIVALDGDTLVVGGPRDHTLGIDTGAATIFQYDGTTWSESHTLLASDAAGSASFGRAVAIDGNTALVSAVQPDGSGDTYAFELTQPVLFASVTSRNGSGINPDVMTSDTLPVLGSTWRATVAHGPETFASFLALGFNGPDPGTPSPFGPGELLMAIVPHLPDFVSTSFGGEHELPIPCDPVLLGFLFPTQGVLVEAPPMSLPIAVPTNALDLVLGY